jgi:hypothetical protein
MKYSLRSLMIAVLVMPQLLAVGWFGWRELWRKEPEVIPYSIMPDDGNRGTPEEWAASIERWKSGEPMFPLPESQAPAPNPPKN